MNRIQQRPTENQRYDCGPDVTWIAVAVLLWVIGAMAA